MNVLRFTTIVPKLGTIVLILGMLSACASPPRVQNDPSIPDNGAVIIRVDNNPYTQPYCTSPYQIGPYCDPYYNQWRYPSYMRQPQTEFILIPGKVVDSDEEKQ